MQLATRLGNNLELTNSSTGQNGVVFVALLLCCSSVRSETSLQLTQRRLSDSDQDSQIFLIILLFLVLCSMSVKHVYLRQGRFVKLRYGGAVGTRYARGAVPGGVERAAARVEPHRFGKRRCTDWCIQHVGHRHSGSRPACCNLVNHDPQDLDGWVLSTAHPD